jgi:hypothetical protein
MLNKLRSRLSAPLLISLLALFLALGGAAFAVQKAPKNSVTSKSIKKNAVTSSDIKNNTVTGNDVNEGTLNLPGSSLPQVSFQSLGSIQYGKDGFGIVHLRGIQSSITNGTAFATLPAGFRPPATEAQAAVSGFSTPCEVQVGADGTLTPFGCNTLFVDVSSVSFATS